PRAFTAVAGLTFKIEDIPGRGEFIAILGPSGCGKSTLLNIIAGFRGYLPPTKGEALVFGKPVSGPGPDRGMVFQKYSSFPHLTVLDNVLFGLNRKGDVGKAEREKLAMDWIARVGLKDHAHKYPRQLSGGQQQRVALARTLVLRPRIILMDEPFSALDEPTRIEMQRLLVDLWHDVSATVFLVTHSIAEAVYLGDRVWIFTQAPGRIAVEIEKDSLPERGGDPLIEQETPQFKEAVRLVAQQFSQVTR
ncbi:MAG: ABC transporter ATP-binding protein, partial [Armatimonadetes bacterium]|nr:ABC transporter ATP-binding protein [Armatimonadota bacterium]